MRLRGALRHTGFTAAAEHLQGAVLADQHLGDVARDSVIVLPVAGAQLALESARVIRHPVLSPSASAL